MLYRVLPRTLDLWGVRSPALLTLSTGRRKTTHHRGHSKPQSSLRCLSSGHILGCKDTGGYAGDPLVKEWMKELHKDFSQQSQEADLGSGKAKEGKEEKDLASSTAEEEEKGQEERKETGSNQQKVWSQLLEEKYQKLDAHTQIIYDYDEEKQRREAGLVVEEVKQEKLKLERGEMGVFDVEELVDLLREDNALDIVVIQIPDEMKYASYMVIVSSLSQRHRTALAELVKGAYKLKKDKKDRSVLMEGKGTDWVAMDMGNIILHIMKPETRETYDLETLWTVGAEYDEKSQVSEDDLVGVRKPFDPLAAPSSPLKHTTAEAVL